MKFICNTDIREIIRKSPMRNEIPQERIDEFKANIKRFLDNVQAQPKEQTQKGYINDFLNDTYYKGKFLLSYEEGGIDTAIHIDNSPKSPIGVIIEAKSTTNAAEMAQKDDLRSKAFYETIYYYLKQRIGQGNIELKYIVITNMYEWFFIDALEYDHLFYHNTKVVGTFKKFERHEYSSSSTAFFYDTLCPQLIDEIDGQIKYTYVDLREAAFNKDGGVKADVSNLYKLFSPRYLLKHYGVQDNNTLNKAFYDELLYIMGLTTRKDNSGKLVIEREAQGKRHEGSLLENAILYIESHDRLENAGLQGSHDEQLFEMALSLSITWINRLLFLKLLEGQLLQYHNGDAAYSFLNNDTLRSYDDVDWLFFQVLALPEDKRRESIRKKYPHVPYLNSSLFEQSKMEGCGVSIGNLNENAELPLYANSVLKKYPQYAKLRLSPLEYLLAFLDAYDFGADKKETDDATRKPLISASVLGLIFEKINGYKDGSVFTPSYITMAMCRHTVRQAVVSKFNAVKGWHCQSLADVRNEYGAANSDIRKEMNRIVDSVKICDPAVGSGHFLVSALNELICIKAELRILADERGDLLTNDFFFEVQNDELVITNLQTMRAFQYVPSRTYTDSQRLQETLFREKRKLIEHCLFGVDINPNSVDICRLRLWIELLKFTYYDRQTGLLQTLPNIDINIKCGNSLLYRLDLHDHATPLEFALNQINWTVEDYKRAVNDYRSPENKEAKRRIEKMLKQFKQYFSQKKPLPESLVKNRRRYEKRLNELTAADVFGQKPTKQQKQEVAKLRKLIAEEERKIAPFRSEEIFRNSIEWRMEFPDVLDADGNFVGFDCVIGNPPYMNIQGITNSQEECKPVYETAYSEMAQSNYDLCNLFVKIATLICAPTGVCSFIFPHKFMNTKNAALFRKWLMEHRYISRLVHFGANMVFSDAITYTCICDFSPQPADGIDFYRFGFGENIRELGKLTFNHVAYDEIKRNSLLYGKNQWIICDSPIEQQVLSKIYEKEQRLGNVFSIAQGIATSDDKLYTSEMEEEREATCIIKVQKTGKQYEVEKRYFRPFLFGKQVHRYSPLRTPFLVFFPYDVQGDKATLVPQQTLQAEYPLTYHYIMDNQEAFKAREHGKMKDTAEWYAYIYPKNLTTFGKPKLVSMEICSACPNVTIDNNKFCHTTKVYNWQEKDKADQHSMEYYLAIVNSNLLWWYMKLTGDTLSGDARTFKTDYLNPFPMPENVTEEQERRLTALASEALRLKRSGGDTAAVEAEIDSLVCDLYGLTGEAKAFICGYASHKA